MRTDYDNATLTSALAAFCGDEHFELADCAGLAARHQVHTACLAGHNHDVVAIGFRP